MIDMDEFNLYLDGIKPAVLVSIEKHKDLRELARKVAETSRASNQDYYIKNLGGGRFMFANTHIPDNMFIEDLGLFLGYPPKACKKFGEERVKTQLFSNNEQLLFVNYGGLKFTSYPETIADDLIWLKERYPEIECYPKIEGVNTFIDGEFVSRVGF